ncbi:MAG: D-alanyl-D-alanine carboxypeptidase [Clostridia bacterium]|nr:D-alanyl-D-alanine carboxypeptidase [Clostridia bacterium]
MHFPKNITTNRSRRRARRRFLYRLRQRVIELTVLTLLVAMVVVPINLMKKNKSPVAPLQDEEITSAVTAVTDEPIPYPEASAATVTLGSEVDAECAILWNVSNNHVVAVKGANTRVYPASVTKVMTLLVAVENITDFTDTFTMTYEILYPLYRNDATIAGFLEGEKVVVEDLLYGTILPSGADASRGLAEYVSGTEEAFVALMNKKAADLGLRDTHFVNTSGLHDKNHYTTAADMAMIMRAAMQDAHCRQVLSTYQYTTAATPEHPEGILLTSTMFSRMYGNEPDGAVIAAGKTGFTGQALHTLVTYAVAEDRKAHEYVLVTMRNSDRWKAVYDAFNLYSRFCGSVEQTKTDAQ